MTLPIYKLTGDPETRGCLAFVDIDLERNRLGRPHIVGYYTWIEAPKNPMWNTNGYYGFDAVPLKAAEAARLRKEGKLKID